MYFLLAFPFCFTVCVVLSAFIYRCLNPLPIFAISKKLSNCVIGHRLAPIVDEHGADDNSKIKSTTSGHSKGVSDKNGFIIPENSLTSLRQSHASGIKTIELDVQMTKDKHPVVFHDTVIGNTFKCDESDKNKRICDCTLSELQGLQFLTTLNNSDDETKHSPYSTERITLFSDVLMFCKENNMNIMIEIKPQQFLFDCCLSITKLVAKYNMEDNVYVASFSPMALLYIRYFTNNICTGYLFTGSATTNLRAELIRQNLPIPFLVNNALTSWAIDSSLRALAHPWMLWLCGNSMVIPQHTFISSFNVDQYRKSGLTVLTWTVNDDVIQKYLFENIGMTIITDYPTKRHVLSGSDVLYK